MATKLIMIEDDIASVHLLKRYVKRADWDVELVHFEYGSDAVYYFEHNNHFDLVVLLDLNLPDMSGIDVLRIIRQDDRYKMTPVVVLTTSNLDEEREACFELGAKHFLEKPFNFDRLISMMIKLEVSFAS